MLSPVSPAPQRSAGVKAPPSARELCYLEKEILSDYAPLGFAGWDIMLAPSVARDTSGWIGKDAAGRVLFCASPEQLYRGDGGLPDRTVPLLLWMTHRSLRVLYHCAPSESYALGQRLATLGARAVGAQAVEECAPAAMGDLLHRWLERDPQALSVFPLLDGDTGAAPLTPWYPEWDEERLAALPDRAELGSTSRYAPPLHLRWRPGDALIYDDGPFTLVPVGMLMDGPGASQEAIQALYFTEDPVHAPLLNDTYGTVITWTIGQMTTVLAALREDAWREQLVSFRDVLAARLGCGVGCIPVRQRTLAALIGSLHEIRGDLSGADEISPPPYPDAASAPPEGARARELRRRLANAVALPFPDEILHPLPA